MVAALTDTTLPLAVTMALAGLGAGMLNPILTTLMYEKVPEELRSRVSGVTTAGCELTMPLGGLAAGLLVDGFGTARALLLFGGAYLLTTLAPVVFPAWRDLDRSTSSPAEPTAALSRREPSPPGSVPAARPRHPSAK